MACVNFSQPADQRPLACGKLAPSLPADGGGPLDVLDSDPTQGA